MGQESGHGLTRSSTWGLTNQGMEWAGLFSETLGKNLLPSSLEFHIVVGQMYIFFAGGHSRVILSFQRSLHIQSQKECLEFLCFETL